MIKQGFAIWITGLPASGKTAVARVIAKTLQDQYGIRIVHLESDAMREVLTPRPTYTAAERDWFYSVLTFIGQLLTQNGIDVLLDATANRKYHRDRARSAFHRFLEVYIKCPLEVCIARDPKGIYSKAKKGLFGTVPGLQEEYEEPSHPDVVIESNQISVEEGAALVLKKMRDLGWF